MQIERVPDGSSTRIIFTVDLKWKIEVVTPSAAFPTGTQLADPQLSVSYSDNGQDGEYELQDPPCGKASVVCVGISSERDRGDFRICHFSYVKSEAHYSCGVRWNPKPKTAAEVFYHDTGFVRCRIHRRQGRICSPDPATPCGESYWENGQLRAFEFGDERRGRYRRSTNKPSYAEYFPNGVAGLEVFSEIDVDEKGKPVSWVCRTADGREREAGSGDIQLVKSRQLTFSGMAVERDFLEDFEQRHGDRAGWKCEGFSEGEKGVRLNKLPPQVGVGSGIKNQPDHREKGGSSGSL